MRDDLCGDDYLPLVQHRILEIDDRSCLSGGHRVVFGIVHPVSVAHTPQTTAMTWRRQRTSRDGMLPLLHRDKHRADWRAHVEHLTGR